MSLRVPLTRPYFKGHEGELVAEVIASGWITQGPKVAEFESAVADYVGAEHAVAVANCTAALHLVLVAAGIGTGDEIVCPSLSFIATANSISHAGASPVFADVEDDSANLDPSAVEAVISPATKAIMVVHQLGYPADIDAFAELGRRHGLLVIEDAAPALGAVYKDRRVGTDPSLACFSFHPRKIVTSGEGGVVTTGDAALADRLRRLRNQGMSISDLDRHNMSRVEFETYPAIGFNYRLSDILATLGLAQMSVLDECLARRRMLALRYNEVFESCRHLRPPVEREGYVHSYQSYMLRLTDGSPLSRDALMQALLDDSIATRRGVMASHLEPPYELAGGSLPNSERIASDAILLPLFPDMSEADQSYVIEAVRRHVEEPG